MAASVLTVESDRAQANERRRNDVGLDSYGIMQASSVYWNLTTPELYEEIARRGAGLISAHGALLDQHARHLVVRRSNLREILNVALFDGHTKCRGSETRKYNWPRPVCQNAHSKCIAASADEHAQRRARVILGPAES